MPRFRLLVLLVLLCGAVSVRAADPLPLDATALGSRVDLGKTWLFAPEDHPAYAGAHLDDSNWRVVSTDRPLAAYGYQSLPFCWYRLHIRLRPDARQVAVLVGGVAGAYEVYANGVLLGGAGNMAAHSMQQQGGIFAYPVRDQALAARPGDLVLAIRFSNQVRRYQIRTMESPLIQASVFLVSQDAAARDTSYSATHIEQINFLLGGLNLLIGLVALALYIALRSRREYLAIAVACLAASVDACVATWEYLSTFSVGKIILSNCFEAMQPLALIEFVRLIIGAPRTRMWLIIEILAILGPVINPVASIGVGPVSIVFAAYFVSLLVMDVVLPALLLRAWWRGNTDARVLLPAILLGIFSDYYQFVRQVAYYFHVFRVGDPWSLSVGSYKVAVNDLGGFAFSITILLFLVLRTVRIARERAEAASEIEAARTMQQLLLSRASQPTPGFAVETVYHPASEVGGDFFLVSPGPDGSLIAVVGDVSGKGLLAAMRVSMILGVLRREDAREPAAILDRLNEALLSQGDLGFTTACCVRLDSKGAFTVANAGHIAPYLAGREIETAAALPLGLAGEQQYSVTHGRVLAGQRLVLMSDGVVEARASSGELYGFDRLPGLTLMPAQDIADIAQRFGQEDDITVLTISCRA